MKENIEGCSAAWNRGWRAQICCAKAGSLNVVMALAESVSIGFTLALSGPRRMLRIIDRAPSVPMMVLPRASEPFSNEAVTPSLSSNDSADIVMPY